jgi:3-dehydroquinate dehydratase II
MMPKTIYVLNGPNLNLLGEREPEIYGYETLDSIKATLEHKAKAHGCTISFHQSNHEGVLIDLIHEARHKASALIINPAALGHTSVALLDALKTLSLPVIECHLSNLAKRESFRHHSYISMIADGVIAGFGAFSYELALDAAIKLCKIKAGEAAYVAKA